MTDELNGPELALAVATILGKEAELYHGQCLFPAPTRIAPSGGPLFINPFHSHPWRPDLGGAAGAEVLDWLRANGQEVSMLDNDMSGPPHLCELSRDGAEVSAQGLGETHWIALCRAVVEVGK